MFKVDSKETAREAYAAIKMFSEMSFKDNVKDFTDEVKREVRKWSHKDNTLCVDRDYGFEIKTRPVKDYGIDGYIVLVELPEWIETESQADKFFEDFLYMECRPSMYDCTGQHFTAWYKLFKRHGRYHAYHSVAVDV